MAKRRRPKTSAAHVDDALLARYTKEIKIEPIAFSCLPPDSLRRLIEFQGKTDAYDGGVLDGDPPILAFKLRDPAANVHPAAMFTAWVWEGFFGTSLTVAFGLRGWEPSYQSRVFFPQDSAVARKILRTRTFRALCIRRDNPEAAFEVVLPTLKGSPLCLEEREALYLNRVSPYDDARAHFWETLELTSLGSQPSARDQLSFSWMRAYRQHLRGLLNLFQWWSAEAPASHRTTDGLPSIVAPAVEFAKTPSTLIANANHFFS